MLPQGVPLVFGTGVSSFKFEKDLTEVCAYAIENGIYSFDTAPSYRTEIPLAKSLHSVMHTHGIMRDSLCFQTKIDPIQMYQGRIIDYFESLLNSMKMDYVDALLVHWPVFEYLEATWEDMLKLKEKGLTKSIGICNVRIKHIKSLKNKGITPDIIQIERHPLNTFEEEIAYISKHKEIILQDYSPLCKMHSLLLENDELEQLSEKYNVSRGLLILRWHIDTGAIPIFTSKKKERIREYSKIESFKISEEDCRKISSLNINHKLYLESLVCPGF